MSESLSLPEPQEPQQQEGLSLDVKSQPAPLSDEFLDSRAFKAHLGLSPLSGMRYEDIRKALQSGQEQDLRADAAAKFTYSNYQQIQERLFKQLRTGDADIDQVNKALTRYSLEKQDPDTVIEQGYAGAYFRATGDMSDPFNRSTDQAPIQDQINGPAQMLQRAGQSLVATREYLNTKKENVSSALENESIFGTVLDTLKNLSSIYQHAKTTGFDMTLLGSAMKNKADALLSLPLGEMKAQLDPFIDKLMKDNPQLAYQFMDYLVGQSTNQETIDNVFDAMGLANEGQLAKALLKGGKGLLFGRARQATADLVKSTTLTPEASPQVAQAIGKGDVKEAAVQGAAERYIADTRGTIDPFKRAMEQAPTFMRRDLKAMKADASNIGADLMNRIEEETHALTNDLLKNVEDTSRMGRINEVTVTKAGMEKTFEEVKNAYPAIANNLMNLKGPIWDPYGASWFVGRIIGRNSGEYFHSYGEAFNWAKTRDWALSHAVKLPRPKNELGQTIATRTPETSYLYGAEIRSVRELGIQGNGFYITDLVPIDETTPTIRAMLGDYDRATSPIDWTGGLIDAYVGWWVRGADETQSFDQQIARKIATYAPAKYLEMIRNHTQNLKALYPASSIKAMFRKKNWKSFEAALRYAQDARDSKGEKGYFFESPNQLVDWYSNSNNPHTLGRLPSDLEVRAYFEFKRLVEADRWFRSQAVTRNKQRIGVQSHQVILEGKDGPIRLDPIEGRRLPVQQLPQGEDGILFLKRDPDHTWYRAGNEIPITMRDEWNKRFAEGRAQIFEIYNTEERPFQNFSGKVRGRLRKSIPNMANAKPRYVAAYRVETRPLDLSKQVNRRYGGHLVPDYPFHIAQANMNYDPYTKIWDYEGDRLVYFVKNRSLGNEFLAKMNEHQRIWNEQGEAAALQYARDNLHIPAEDLHKDYKSSTHPTTKEKIEPRFRLNEPFYLVPSNSKIIDLGKDALESRYTKMEGDKIIHRFRDGTRSGNLARQSVVEFTQQRDAYDLFELANRGTQANPMYHLDPATLIDPVPMLMRGLNRIMHSLQLDDYKIQAMEHWLFGKNVLDPTTGKMVGAANFMKDNITSIQASPFHYWNNIEWKAGLKDTPEIKLLEADKYKIDMFIGSQGPFDGLIRRLEQNAADIVYKVGGGKALDMVPTWMIGKIKDGPRAVRNILYSTKIGMLNPHQFFLHFVTGVNGWLIDPERAFHGMAGALMHGWTVTNSHPGTIAEMDRVLSEMGLFKPGDFTMFQKGLNDSGFLKAESGSLALVDSPYSSKVIRNKWNVLMHFGTKPFQWGVNSVRAAAWYMAAAEWRAGRLGRSISGSRWSTRTPIPVGAASRDDFGAILARADDLAHNMSRASTSGIQKGMASFGSQFSSFNHRMLGLLTGKRLTVPEKIRLFMGYAGLYGAPAAGGLISAATYIRRLIQGNDPISDQPYVPGQNLLSTALYEGLISTMLYEGTGNIYNIGESFGAKDLGIVEDIVNGSSSLLEIYGGAAYTGVKNTKESLTPFYMWASTLMNDDDERFRLTPQHFVNVLKEIPTVNYADRAHVGVTTGRWISRNGQYLNSTSATNAILSNFFGVQEQETADIYNKERQIQDWRHSEDAMIRYATKEINLEMLSIANKDWNQARTYHMNAKVFLQGIPESEQARVLTRIYTEQIQPMKDKIDFEYYLGRDRPLDQQDAGRKAWNSILQMRNR